jgi:hypothetical protein
LLARVEREEKTIIKTKGGDVLFVFRVSLFVPIDEACTHAPTPPTRSVIQTTASAISQTEKRVPRALTRTLTRTVRIGMHASLSIHAHAHQTRSLFVDARGRRPPGGT